MDVNPVVAERYAPVVSLEARRRARRARRRQSRLSQPAVSLWFGAAALAGAVAVWALMSAVLRSGIVGVGITLLIASALAWKAAGSWLERQAKARARAASRARHPSAMGRPQS